MKATMDAEANAPIIRCKICDRIIPRGRLKAMPGVRTCIEHSEAVMLTDRVDGIIDGTDRDDLIRACKNPREQE